MLKEKYKGNSMEKNVTGFKAFKAYFSDAAAQVHFSRNRVEKEWEIEKSFAEF